jgi:hypothetical protein
MVANFPSRARQAWGRDLTQSPETACVSPVIFDEATT